MTPRSLPRPMFVVLVLTGLAVACADDLPTEPERAAVLAAKGGVKGNGGGGSSDPTVDTVEPASAPQDTTLDVHVLGSNFDDGSSVALLLDGSTTKNVKTNSTQFVSTTELIANVTIAADAQPDLYDVQVTTSRGKKGIGIEIFEITLSKFGQLALEITFRDDGDDGLRSDGMAGLSYCDAGVPCYEEGQDFVQAHLSSNGNLMFWLDANSEGTIRRIEVLGDLLVTRRIYTNDNQDSQGNTAPDLISMEDGTITARMIVERGDGNGHYRYGVQCDGDSFARDDGNAIPEERISVTRSGFTWTLEGWGARHCIKSGKGRFATWEETPVWMPFRMTMVAIPWPE